jgi:hypothetical protein
MTLLTILFTVFLIPNYQENIIEVAHKKQKQYNPSNKKYVVIIDYKKKISEERLFLIDMKTDEILLKSKVGHAFNSGKEIPTIFSNEVGSLKSCYGGFITSETYFGYYGYSLVIDGKDKGINDNARKRKIVFHSTKKMTNPTNPLTYGCFATSDDVNKKLIDLIKGGCLVYILN